MSEPAKQVIPQRLAHNKAHLDAFLKSRGIKSQFPPVEQQLESVVVAGLFKGGYNPSIIRHNGGLVMAYRFHADDTAATRIAVAELDDSFRVTSNQQLEINDETSSHEDPRLFEFKGALWMAYVSSTWPKFPASTVKYVELSKPDHWRVGNPVEYHHAERQTMEKNHCPFPAGDKLHIIYRHSPQQVIYTADERGDMITPSLRWPYGEIRGGTVPMPYHGRLIKFFHSSIRGEMPPTFWRYFIGALVMDAEPPFKMLAVSKRPILRGSEVGGDESVKRFKKNIVFPAGAIEHEGGWLLSVGVNDSQCLLVKVKELNL